MDLTPNERHTLEHIVIDMDVAASDASRNRVTIHTHRALERVSTAIKTLSPAIQARLFAGITTEMSGFDRAWQLAQNVKGLCPPPGRPKVGTYVDVLA